MNEKQIKKVYTKYSEKSAPDMNKLWEKIDKGLEEKSENRITSTENPEIRHRKMATRKQLGVAAACVALIIAIPAFFSTLSTKSNDMSINMQEHNDIQYEDAQNVGESIENAPNNEMQDNTTIIQDTVYYEELNLAKTQGFVNMLNNNSTNDEYFVLDNVLEETEVFADVVVEKVYLSEGGDSYVYELKKVDGEIDNDISQNITIKSASSYVLLQNREYLLPLKTNSAGGYELAFDNAPQIEITLDDGMIFHNGWEILDDDTTADVIYPQNSVDDFFYDRMKFSYATDLAPLLEKWNEIRNAKKIMRIE